MSGRHQTKKQQQAAAIDKNLIDLMHDPSAQKIMLLGASDTGKTSTLYTMLGAASVGTAVVDLDLGQSHIGPPAMLAWGIWRSEYKTLEDISPERLFFVGATTPLANPTAVISGAAAVVSDAVEHSDKVLIDTSGAVAGRFARRLKLEKIRAIRPDAIVALQRSDELEHILEAIEQERLAPVVRARFSKRLASKNAKSRAGYRQGRFASYFAGAKEIRLSLRDAEVLRFGAAGHAADEYEGLADNLLVGLADRVGRHLGMGILRAIDRDEHDVVLLADVPPGTRVAALIPGRMCLTPEGREQPVPK